MEPTISTLTDRVNAALLASDWATLTELVAPHACITGPRGYMINRDEWIAVHRDAAYRQIRLDVTECEVHAYDHAGVRVDTVDSACLYQGETITGRFRVTSSWMTDHGRWQLTALQYTALAP